MGEMSVETLRFLAYGLIEVLKDEAFLHERLSEILREEEKAIIAGDIEGLRDATTEKEALAQRGGLLAEQRIGLWKDLACQVHLQPRTMQMESLVGHVDTETGRLLLEASSMLRERAARVHEGNKHNRALLQHTLDLVRGSLRILGGLAGGPTVYQRTGALEMEGKSGTLLLEAI